MVTRYAACRPSLRRRVATSRAVREERRRIAYAAGVLASEDSLSDLERNLTGARGLP